MTTKDLAIAASTIWVVVAAVLVLFMQAGFAFLEAGLTRMKNAAHIAGKNVLIFGVCSLVYWAVGFGLAFGDGNTFVVDDRLAGAVVSAITDAARSGSECGDGLVWTTPVYQVTHNRTGLPLERADAA